MTSPALQTPIGDPLRSSTAGADHVASGRRQAMATAARDVTPLAVALVPFSLAIGATIAESDLPGPAALAGSVLLLAGAAQLAAIELADSGAGLTVAVVTALAINARLVLYSAALSTWFEGLPRRRRWLLAVPLIDQSFLLGMRRFADRPSLVWRQWYYLTVSAALITCFVTSQVAGYWVGTGLPAGLGLHLAAPLAFTGLLGSATTDRQALVAAAVAAAAVVAASAAPDGLALPLATVAGVAAGARSAGRAS